VAKKKLAKIKSGWFDRGYSLTKVAMKSGASLAANRFRHIWSENDLKEKSFRELMQLQAQWLADELGNLKGSLMKVGQMLALYGEHFFPEDVLKVLRSLNEDSPPLDWESIEPIIRRRLSADQLAQLDIETDALAAASMGQVHRARIRATGEEICLKVQYPGVSQAIDNDLRTLRGLLSMMRLVPTHKPGFDELMKEVRFMLRQEVDYMREMKATDQMRELLAPHPDLKVPKTYPDFTGPKILATEYLEGYSIDSEVVTNLSPERRGRLARAFAKLFIEELFTHHLVQTDPHFGNYKIQIDPNGEDDRVVLLDFGAMRKFAKPFVAQYRRMVVGALQNNDIETIAGATGVGFLQENDSDAMKECFLRIAYTAIEPWLSPEDPRLKSHLFDENHCYLWGQSDLPIRVTELAKDYALTFRLRPPPREVVFLDRKIGGVFSVLKKLDGRFDNWSLVSQALLPAN
jgi:predicted unusual protein kinase regulating ubiquinone biosynthesis (AarF/ABC1/UbiB family)